MRQILLIHGGSTFPTHDSYLTNLKSKQIEYERLKPTAHWNLWLKRQLPDDDILALSMPNSSNAQYDEWVIMFEKVFPLLEAPEIIIVGHSLGAIFLAKYLSERALPFPCRQLVFVAAPYDDETSESLGGFKLTSKPNFVGNFERIDFIHARDDFVVDISELEKYRTALPQANYHVLDTGTHFFGDTFPELLEIIKK